MQLFASSQIQKWLVLKLKPQCINVVWFAALWVRPVLAQGRFVVFSIKSYKVFKIIFVWICAIFKKKMHWILLFSICLNHRGSGGNRLRQHNTCNNLFLVSGHVYFYFRLLFTQGINDGIRQDQTRYVIFPYCHLSCNWWRSVCTCAEQVGLLYIFAFEYVL